MSSPPSKKQKLSPPQENHIPTPPSETPGISGREMRPEDDSLDDLDTDTKLAILSSLFPNIAQAELLEVLISSGGVVVIAQKILSGDGVDRKSLPRRGVSTGAQASLSSYLPPTATSQPITIDTNTSNRSKPPPLPKPQKGKPLLLFHPHHISALTPCTLIPNFLPRDTANELLLELLGEAEGFAKKGSKEARFWMFGREVWSRHTAGFYVRGDEEWTKEEGREEEESVWYTYNGMKEQKKRIFTERMEKLTEMVEEKVREVIRERWRRELEKNKNTMEPLPLEMGRKKYESPHPWTTNAAIVNCYDGGGESVGWHADQVTYLGPMATIASVSLGVGREFGLRKEGEEGGCGGVIKVWLPHNSLLIMEAGMQEGWKHCVYPAPAISQHPFSGSKRINITYRYYRPSLTPKYLPICKCENPLPGILRTVMDKGSANYGRYFWGCQGAYQGNAGGEGCGFFQWAEWDEDGEMKGWRERKRAEDMERGKRGRVLGGGGSQEREHKAEGKREGDDGIVAIESRHRLGEDDYSRKV